MSRSTVVLVSASRTLRALTSATTKDSEDDKAGRVIAVGAALPSGEGERSRPPRSRRPPGGRRRQPSPPDPRKGATRDDEALQGWALGSHDAPRLRKLATKPMAAANKRLLTETPVGRRSSTRIDDRPLGSGPTCSMMHGSVGTSQPRLRRRRAPLKRSRVVRGQAVSAVG